MFGVTALSWDERDGLILTASADNSVKLWHAASGAVIRTFTAPEQSVRGLRNAVNAAAMSDGANLVAIGSDDGLRLWNGKTGALLETLIPAGRLVRTLAMNRAGTMILAAGTGEIDKGAQPFLSAHRRDASGKWSTAEIPIDGLYEIDDLTLSSDGKLLAIAGDRVTHRSPGGVETAPFFAIWEVGSAQPVKPIELSAEGESPETRVIGFTPAADALFVRERDTIYRVDRSTMLPKRFCTGRTATLSSDGNVLAVAPGDSSGTTNATAAELRGTRLGEVISRISWPDAANERTRSFVAMLAVSADNRDVVVGLNSGKLARWSGKDGAYRWIVRPRELGPRGLHILDDAGDRLLLVTDQALRVFDLNSGRQRLLENPQGKQFGVVVMSRDGTRVAAGGDSTGLHVWDTETGKLLYASVPQIGGVVALAFSPDGKTLALAPRGGNIELVRVADGSTIRQFKKGLGASALAFLPDGRSLAAGDELGEVHFFALVPSVRPIQPFSAPEINATVSAIDFSASGSRMAVGYGNGFNRAVLYDLRSRASVMTGHATGWINDVAFDSAGLRIVTVGQDQRAFVWNAASGAELGNAGSRAVILGLGLSRDGRRLATIADGTIQLWSLSPEGRVQPLAELADLEAANWIAVGEDGRFDTGDPEELKQIAWLMPDDPLRPLAVDTYMRDYYEPRLLPRLLGCRNAEPLQPEACRDAFTPIRPLRELNRVAPEVGFARIEPGRAPDEAVVDLFARGAEDRSQTNGKQRTEAFDLRLFRDGQLVGHCPRAHSGPVDPDDCFRFTVPLAHREGPVRFTAYAFNEDRVRSPVAEYIYRPFPRRAPRPPRAYVITIGVNAYAGGKGTLTYAAKDARDVASALNRIPGFDVVTVKLLSDGSTHDATRAQIGAVMEMLAGETHNRALLNGVEGADLLEQATPDDVVILSFSGHGYTAPTGEFYLLGADSEAGVPVTPQRIEAFISSELLRDWLAPIDAGQIALIIDACHSAASVNQPGFKPGPMGDRGLGQLAYDKGIRILAATQVDEVAIETGGLQQGLLTFALVRRGLGLDGGAALADANDDGQVTLAEWLRYGEAATPALYREAIAGTVKLTRRDAAPDPRFVEEVADQAQTPQLFDYYRGGEELRLGPARAAGVRSAAPR
jgi:WD40 repeat protein/uncharacterized caspase-like protein